MRRIARIQQQPAAALTKCLPSPSSTHSVRSRAAVAIASRPRDFSTTPARPARPSRPWTAPHSNKVETIREMTTASQPTDLPHLPAEAAPAAAAANTTAALEAPEEPIATDLVLPPAKRVTAPRPENLAPHEYVAAHSADELPVVGGLDGWFSEATDHWGPSKSFAGFATDARVTHPALLELCARRAVLEALAVRSAGVKPLLTASWRADGGWERALGLGMTVDANGKAKLDGNVQEVVEGLLEDFGARETMMPVEKAQEILSVTSPEWKQVSLKDAKLKFAITKRIFQLTGHAIPDAKLLNVHTMGGLLATIVKPEPPRRVFEAVQRRGELAKLPNVSVYPSRRTPVDVAKDLGRWKVVEKELQKRGLPVLGPDNVDKFREGEWYFGPRTEKKDRKQKRR